MMRDGGMSDQVIGMWRVRAVPVLIADAGLDHREVVYFWRAEGGWLKVCGADWMNYGWWELVREYGGALE